MKYCPITYEPIEKNEVYSTKGLKSLSAKLDHLNPLEFTASELRSESIARAGKMSIQGVQLKLSAVLKIKAAQFEIVDQFGQFILKPQSEYYTDLPENEALTMTLAKTIGLDVPLHGLIYSKDNTRTYFIKRFDRTGHRKKLAVEDFAQLSQSTRDTKYNTSMEKMIKVLEFCTFPRIEALKFFKLTLFNFLVGNEDMHAKNFSLITRDNKIMLSPVYDLLNTSIALSNPEEELALPLNSKKRNLTKKDFLQYFAIEKLLLNANVVNGVLREIKEQLPNWHQLIQHSFLSSIMKEKYLALLQNRCSRLEIL